MFENLFKKEESPSLWRMKMNKEKALDLGADAVRKWFLDFYEKCVSSKIDWSGGYQTSCMEKIVETAMSFLKNTTEGEIIEGEDLLCIKGIMAEFEKIYDEIMELKTTGNHNNNPFEKMYLMDEIFCKNMTGTGGLRKDENNIHKGKTFERYKDLYLVISLVNEHYYELSKNGLDVLKSVWYPFWKAAEENSWSEDEKIKYFLGIVNGTMKFHPIYEYKAIGYTIKPIDYNETIVNHISTEYDTEKSMPQTNVKFEIEDEKLIRSTK